MIASPLNVPLTIEDLEATLPSNDVVQMSSRRLAAHGRRLLDTALRRRGGGARQQSGPRSSVPPARLARPEADRRRVLLLATAALNVAFDVGFPGEERTPLPLYLDDEALLRLVEDE